ncbi:MAG TPA: NAD-dependent epimerase/dehydratase family protein [Acetobacteraceae bacterium]|nr:NAD-dependent epimerase/dehydratase family protein [Acetobacteraceae bacterium]
MAPPDRFGSGPILLTGATGFLGRHTRPLLERRYGPDQVVSVSSADYNLMDAAQVDRLLAEVRPRCVVHYAAYSGGIGANRTYPADFYYRNTLLTALMFEACARHKVAKLVYPMGGCSYPAKAVSPIDESQLFCGYPQDESAGYSTAKMMGVVAARSYRAQYGLNATVIVPGNMYGEFDNFHPLDSHVVPAMIRRYYEAMLEGRDEVAMWGTGSPQRDFVYAGDVAATIPFFIERFDEVGPVNISSGTTTPIRTLAEEIARLVGFQGRIVWDTSKPDGQQVKIFSVERLSSLGLSCDTPLAEGLRRTIAWFGRNYAAHGDGLRL